MTFKLLAGVVVGVAERVTVVVTVVKMIGSAPVGVGCAFELDGTSSSQSPSSSGEPLGDG